MRQWDPFYLVDRTVQMLFLGGCCFLYLSQGLAHCSVGTLAYLSLRSRIHDHGLILSEAMQLALADSSKALVKVAGPPPEQSMPPPPEPKSRPAAQKKREAAYGLLGLDPPSAAPVAAKVSICASGRETTAQQVQPSIAPTGCQQEQPRRRGEKVDKIAKTDTSATPDLELGISTAAACLGMHPPASASARQRGSGAARTACGGPASGRRGSHPGVRGPPGITPQVLPPPSAVTA